MPRVEIEFHGNLRQKNARPQRGERSSGYAIQEADEYWAVEGDLIALPSRAGDVPTMASICSAESCVHQIQVMNRTTVIT